VFRRTIALALAVTAALLGGCASQPTSPADCRATGLTREGSLVEVVADPPDSTIRGILPGAAPPAARRPYEVRWLLDSRKAGPELRIQSAREGTGQVYRQQFGDSSRSGLIAQFQTTITFPSQGCWDTDVFTGTALGSMTFKVV
jgi:hypothetical protein